MKKQRLLIAAAVMAVLLLGGAVGAELLTRDIEGVIVYDDLEGGAWFIQAKGELFLPINLTEDMQVEGLRVKFRVVERDDVFTIIMRGKPVEIIRVLN